MKKYALVTGASRGLGREIALQLAKLNIDTILVSSTEAVKETQRYISETYNTDCQAFIIDLTSESEIKKFAETVNANFEINILVNNVGTGGSRTFATTDTDYLCRIINLNILCTSLITRLLLPNLMRNAKSYVMNIGSMAALTATAHKTIYPASKAFVHTFSMSMREELKKDGISVTLAIPGAMATNDDVRQRIEKQGFWGRATLKSTEEIAEKFVKGMLKGKRQIMVNPLSYFLSKVIPQQLRIRMLSKIVENEIS